MAPKTRASFHTKAQSAPRRKSPVPKEEPQSDSQPSSPSSLSSSSPRHSRGKLKQDTPASERDSPSPKRQDSSTPAPPSPTKSSAAPSTTTTTKMSPKPLIKTTPHALRMSYRIARGEQGVLTFEPYKSALLPLWRFRTVPVAQRSSADLWRRFRQFGDESDFVGMDMARKFIQMGMTRAKRYANHKGGRKYKPGTREELPRSRGHEGQGEKEAASLVFREVWERCKQDEVYRELKDEFLKEQREWERGR